MRRSQQHENCFVLSLCHELKVKHFIVIPVSSLCSFWWGLLISPKCHWLNLATSLQVLEDGKKYLTLDDGKTRFIDLLQLVEFYQINKGALPVCLTRPCICVPLWTPSALWTASFHNNIHQGNRSSQWDEAVGAVGMSMNQRWSISSAPPHFGLLLLFFPQHGSAQTLDSFYFN